MKNVIISFKHLCSFFNLSPWDKLNKPVPRIFKNSAIRLSQPSDLSCCRNFIACSTSDLSRLDSRVMFSHCIPLKITCSPSSQKKFSQNCACVQFCAKFAF